MKNKILKGFLSIGLFLLYLELLLRLGAVLFLFSQDFKNHITIAGGHVYKIMCIGDSSTAEGGEDSYPSQLEKILNARHGLPKFKVINQGLPAASSPIIMRWVESWLDQYRPDMVVCMMGANNRSDLTLTPTAKSVTGPLSALKSLKVYKLARGVEKSLVDHIKEKMASFKPSKQAALAPSPFKSVPLKYVQMFFAAMEAESQKHYDEAEEIFINFLGVPDLEITLQQRAATELSKCYLAQKKYKDLMLSLQFNFNIWEFEVSATDTVQHLCQTRTAPNEVLGLLTDLVAQKPQSIAFNSLLQSCYLQYGDRQMADVYLNKINVLRGQGDNIQLKEDYLNLHRMLKERHIKGVYVQYPLRQVNDLKRLFSNEEDYSSIIFIDNKGVFKEASDPQKYGEYFSDNAMNDIGHCTAKGNHLLAKSVAEGILKYLH